MRIVVVEDNTALSQAISFQLKDEGHAVDLYDNGNEAAAFLAADPPDLVVLDVNLPGMNGLEVLRQLRRAEEQVPVLLLTARGDMMDRVAGLDAGADDYLVKPFDMPELSARIRALLRRRNTTLSSQISVGPLTFDITSREVLRDGKRLDVPRREVALFEALALAHGRLVSRERLMEHLYGVGTDVELSTLEVHISRLRKRLDSHSVSIRTVRGFGYLMEPET